MYLHHSHDVSEKNVDFIDIKEELEELQMTGEMVADLVNARPDFLTDMGALNHPTGDRLALSDFGELTVPFPLCKKPQPVKQSSWQQRNPIPCQNPNPFYNPYCPIFVAPNMYPA